MTLPTSGLITVNDRGARAATTFGSVAAAGGNMVFIKKLTASSSGTLSFVDGASSVVLDSTYKEYLFTFNNMHQATDEASFSFNGSIDSGSNYNVTKTTTFFRAFHTEGDGTANLSYSTGRDLAQSTDFQILAYKSSNANDAGHSGTLHLFNPSSTTFVKHFVANMSSIYRSGEPGEYETFVAGYMNTTSAVDAIQFKMSSGNIDAGDICLYGIL
jgi:hypothetical protein